MKKNNIPDKQELKRFYEDLKSNQAFFEMLGIKQHRSSNTYRHVCMVTEESLWYAFKRNLKIDYYSLIRGAFLHDLFLYDWRKEKNKKWAHLFKHPRIAYENASKIYELTPIEKDIILHHMFPITLVPPRTKEGLIVSLIDKKVTIEEVLTKKKKILFFDLDGTLVDSTEDINTAINYAITKFGYPTISIKQTKKDMIYGVTTLIARSIPGGFDDKNYKECLSIFKDYYKDHCVVKTKPYEGMFETLKTLRERGYRFAVVTNKFQEGAERIINSFYPNLFEYVQGEDQSLKKKPAPDMVKAAMKKMKIKKKKNVIYIGDSDIDLETANNAGVSCILVTYGCRDRAFLIKLKGETSLVDSPEQLVNYLLQQN